ncbi:unnamed protein product, partial [Sphagnum compactum]
MPLNSEDRVNAVEIAKQFQNMAGQVLSEAAEATGSAKTQGKFTIIDYEYGSYNYRGYDIANHFNEHAGFECDYSLYPSKEKQFHFFRHYLQQGNLKKVRNANEKELEELYVKCNFYSLVSHMYWAIRAIVQ